MKAIESILGSMGDYILIRLMSVPLSADDSDLRVLDQDVGPSVSAIWSESKQSIVALAFDKSNWEEADAKAWVAESKKTGKEAKAASATEGLIWGDSGQDDLELEEGPLCAFWGSLGDGSDAAEEGDGLIWKEILHPGTWFKSNTGKPVQVTAHIVKEAFRAFSDGYPRYVSVPADHHWTQTRGIVPVEKNRGFVSRLKLLGDKLFAGFSFTNPDTQRGVQDGSIADVSAYLQPDVTHNATGKHYDWALRHVLLTNNPLVPDLAQWGVIAADDTDEEAGRQISNYVQASQEGTMTEKTGDGVSFGEGDEITLSGEAATEYAYLRKRGVTSAQLLALSEQTAQLEAIGLSVESLVAQAATMREKSRNLEISQVIAAMEGTSVHSGVTQIEGFRHQPVVVEAVSRALQTGISALSLSSDEDGQTPVDQLILDVINSIPESGRLPVEASEAGSRHDGGGDGGEEKAVSDEDIDAFLAQVG